MTIARYALLVLATASLAAPVQAQVSQTPATAPIMKLEPLKLSEQELDLIDDACRIDHAYRNDRERLITFRQQAVREGDDARLAAIDRMGRELDAWRKASIEHLWTQLSFAGRRQLKEQMESGCEPRTDAETDTEQIPADQTQRPLPAARPADFKGTIAIPHARMDRELDHLRRVMNRRADMLEEMLPEPTKTADSKFVSRTGNSLTIAMPEDNGGSKKRTANRAPAITKSSCRTSCSR